MFRILMYWMAGVLFGLIKLQVQVHQGPTWGQPEPTMINPAEFLHFVLVLRSSSLFQWHDLKET